MIHSPRLTPGVFFNVIHLILMSNLPTVLQQQVSEYGSEAVLENLYIAFANTINVRDTMALLLEKRGIIVTNDCQVGQTGSTDDDGNYHPLDYSSIEPEMREHLLQQAEACHVGCPRA